MPTVEQSKFTPKERRLRASRAAHIKAGTVDRIEATAAARAAGPGQLDYWLAQVPDTVPEDQRVAAAESLKRAHYQGLALKSAKARRAKSKTRAAA